ncbi:metalloregulator ArsR/SmtB family transcription factor [Geomonas sp.]|uniref:ArsR/SmtB family transcription factor n=1 Tax=Geomonas sp. TaxID=2651584 RepID=UPI002B48B475|nr:metalloregulator ArsR/SmtB family transcription factor [Geomonas sp.]HJV36262.1 metalloregulator ArsR/SmtB family transcription factor [Geomonas sp.]
MKKTIQQFKALADETRLRLLALLLSAGELCVCDLTAALQLPQSTVSRHLAYLKGAGWVNDRRVGVWIYYSIATDSVMQQEIADVLCKRLPQIPSVAEDIKRLASFSEGASCA